MKPLNSKSKAGNFIRKYSLDVLISFILATLIIFFMSFAGYAQNVGINNPAPHSKSLLDLTSTDKGLLAPRMTQAQRTAMFPAADATAKGMLVYQTDNTQGFYYYDGATWQLLNNGANGWGVTGNAGTSPATNFFGTTDSNDVAIKTNNQQWMRFTANKKIGIGATTFSNPTARIEIADEDGLNSDFAMRVAGVGYPDFTFVKNRGTLSTPSATFAGDVNGVISNWAHDGTKYLLSSRISFLIDSNTTVNDVAGSIRFYTSNNNLTPEAMRISSNGSVGIGNANPQQKLDVQGNINIVADSNYRIGNSRVLSIKGGYNLFVGANTGLNNTGGYNCFVGSGAGNANTTGGSNAFFGHYAGWSNTTGGFNSYIGNNSGLANVSGTGNVFVGSHAGYNGTTGAYNTFVGGSAGYNNTDSNNVFVGINAGYNNTTGKGNLFIGSYADGVTNNLNYSTAIGYNAKVAVNNAISLGQPGTIVGIGMSSPGFPLNFANTLGDKISLWGNSGLHYGFGVQASLFQVHSAGNNDDIAFGYGSSSSFSEKVRFKGNGKVGIGTSTPGSLFASAILEIADSSGGVNRDVVIRSSNNTNIQQVLAFVRTRGTYSSPSLVQNNDNLGRVSGVGYDGSAPLTSAEIQFHVDSIAGPNSMPGNITFNTTPSNNGTISLERMRIDRNGKVGIGTSSPSAKLDVVGSVKITDGTQGLGKVLTSDAAGIGSWQTITAANVNAWGMNGNNGTNAATNFIGTADAVDMNFRTNNALRMTISSAGNIGINGAPNPLSKLYISAPTAPGLLIDGSTNYDGITVYVNGTGFNNNGLYVVNSGTGNGIFGKTGVNSGTGNAVYGMAQSTTGTGVEGLASAATGINYGIKGITNSSSGYSGYFSGGSFYTSGNSGFGTTTPNTQVDINGAISVREDATLSANAATFNVTVGNRSYFRINSNAAPASRVINLSNGLQTGQVLIIECTATGGVNGIRMADAPATNNTNLASVHDMYEGDIITLIWNGTDWMETSFANN